MNKLLAIALFAISASLNQIAFADEKISLGVKLLGAGWSGDNGSGANEFDSDNGGQVAFSIAYSVDKFYAGLNLQGGKYKFTNIAPDQFNTTGRLPVGSATVDQNDFDLLVGYYFWPQVSLFADIKAVGNSWSNNAYEQNFSGLGLGVSGFIPQSELWTLFGSVGFIASGEIKDNNDNKVGDGSSTALELGALYKLNEVSQINMGIKFRNYAFEHLNNTKQDYSVNALFIGYTHSFTLE